MFQYQILSFGLQVAANAILPVAIDKYTVNGLQGGKNCLSAFRADKLVAASDAYSDAERVIFIDLDNKFDVLRLMMVRHSSTMPGSLHFHCACGMLARWPLIHCAICI